MNWLLFPTLALAFLFYFASNAFSAKTSSGPKTLLLISFAVLIGLPGLIFAAYYLKIFKEPIWLYR